MGIRARGLIIVASLAAFAACGLDLTGSLPVSGDARPDSATSVDAEADGSLRDASTEPDSDLDAGLTDADAAGDACPATTTFQAGTLAIPPKTKPVTIDGNLDDWSCATFFSYDSASAAFVDAVVNSANVYAFAVSWDSAFVYVAARVKDATTPRGANTGSQIYKNDAIEVFLGNDSPYTSTFSARDHQYVVDWSNRAYVYQPTVNGPPPAGFQSAATSTATGFDVELRIPASEVGVATLSANTMLGFAFASDESNGANQHGWALWHRPSGIACSSGCCQIWCDARYFGGLLLKN